MMKTICIVAPIYNEEPAIPLFLAELEKQLSGQQYSVLFVDDGSTDAGPKWLQDRINAGDTRLGLIRLSRNFGKEAALTAGIDHASGDAVIPMDVDLQDPPALIPEMLAKWRAGAEVVLAVRSDRQQDSFLKRTSANAFYTLMGAISDIPIIEGAGDFRLLDREVVEAFKQLREKNRYTKGLLSWPGFRVAKVYYSRPDRIVGESKFKPMDLADLAGDGIIAFSTFPLKLLTVAGLLASGGAFVYLIVVVLKTLVFGIDEPGYASMLSAILFFNGLTMAGIGVLGEYIGRIYTEVKARPIYVVRSRSGSLLHDG